MLGIDFPALCFEGTGEGIEPNHIRAARHFRD